MTTWKIPPPPRQLRSEGASSVGATSQGGPVSPLGTGLPEPRSLVLREDIRGAGPPLGDPPQQLPPSSPDRRAFPPTPTSNQESGLVVILSLVDGALGLIHAHVEARTSGRLPYLSRGIAREHRRLVHVLNLPSPGSIGHMHSGDGFTWEGEEGTLPRTPWNASIKQASSRWKGYVCPQGSLGSNSRFSYPGEEGGGDFLLSSTSASTRGYTFHVSQGWSGVHSCYPSKLPQRPSST